MKNWKRYLSIAMTLVMLLGVLPTAAFAEGEDPVPQADPTITLTPSETVYTGGDITVTVAVSGLTGYTVTCPNAKTVSNDSITVVNAGTYTVTAEASDGNSVSENFTISPKPINQLTITLAPDAQTYDGTQKTPGVTVKHGQTELTKDTHYTVAYGTNINAGENAGTVTITAKTGTNYTGNTTVNFTIQPMTVADSALEVTIAPVTYGTPASPVVKLGDKALSAETDYDVTCANTNVGTQDAVISLKGNYYGGKTVQYTINAKPLDETAIQPISSQTYTGSAITPVVVKNGETTLTKDTDYTVVYSNNTNVGTASAEVTFTGNYSGGPFTKTFTISPKNISAAVLGGLNTTYNPGSRPVPTVTLDGKTLVEGNDKDYTLSYDETTTSGSLIITVTGRGNYTGSKQATVAVLATSDTTAPVISGVTNGGTYHEAKTITVTDTNLERVEIYQGTTLVNTWNPAEGTTTVSTTLALSDTDTAYVIKAYDKVGNNTEFTVTVTKKSIAASMITIAGADNIVFDGTAKTPTITVKDGSTTIAADQYTLRWENNTNAGTATVKVTMNSNAAYKGEATKTFTIKPKTITSSSAIQDIADQTYTGSALTPAITVKDGETRLEEGTTKDYTVIYSNNTNPGTAKVTVVLRGNYQGVLQKTFTINPNLTVLADNIKTLAAKTTLTYAEKQQIKQLKAAYDALSAENKAIVDSAVGSTLMASFKSKASAAAYKLLNKPSVGYYKYVMGTSSNVVIEIDADYSRTLVTEIRMGKYETVIDPANYEVKEGSVVVTLSSSYLKTIKTSGKYNLYIDLMDLQTGRTETLQTVVRVVPATDIPQTGDPFQMNLWIGLLGASVLALAGLGVYEVVKKKKNSRKRLEAAMDLGEESPDEANINE